MKVLHFTEQLAVAFVSLSGNATHFDLFKDPTTFLTGMSAAGVAARTYERLHFGKQRGKLFFFQTAIHFRIQLPGSRKISLAEHTKSVS